MTIEQAQKEVRTVFMGGFPGQTASGALWLGSAAASTWLTPRHGIVVMILGGMFIFPVTMLLLLMGRPASLSPANPMGQLAMQVAFTIPLAYPLIAAAALYRLSWFYPALMVVVGAHYLPFTFLYGMKVFIAWCALLVGGGVAIGLYASGSFALAGWLTGGALGVFAIVGWLLTREG